MFLIVLLWLVCLFDYLLVLLLELDWYCYLLLIRCVVVFYLDVLVLIVLLVVLFLVCCDLALCGRFCRICFVSLLVCWVVFCFFLYWRCYLLEFW